LTRLRRASFAEPEATRQLARGAGSLVRVGPLAVGRATLSPGWRWSTDVKPLAGTVWCQSHHLHILIRGRFAVEMDDGERATFVPGEVFDVPPGHDAWVEGDEEVELYDISGNSTDFGLPSSHPKAVLTMLMTDIVGSTELAGRLGDTAWRQVLADHNRVVRSVISQFDGREINTTGDGFLATFDSAAGALRSAVSARQQVKHLGLEIRAGVHTGEVEMAGSDLRGIAVHATARIMAAAGPGEVLASAVTRWITDGAGLRFVERGPRELKGLPSPVELFAVE
jgi:class 3 adenylate cyclase